MTDTPPTGRAARFTLDPLPSRELAAMIAYILTSSETARRAGAMAGITAEWSPVPAPVVHPVRFSITRAGDPAPGVFPADVRDVYLIAALSPSFAAGPGGPNHFGVATSYAHARHLAHVYMAAPPPSRRHGYIMHPAGHLEPAAWSSRAARRSFIRSLTT